MTRQQAATEGQAAPTTKQLAFGRERFGYVARNIEPHVSLEIRRPCDAPDR